MNIFDSQISKKKTIYIYTYKREELRDLWENTQPPLCIINSLSLQSCTSSQFLQVPELMPFRLTRQFVNLMQPLKESGLIQSVMVHSLRAYRAEPDLLLNTMDVFVKEPSLDWKVTISTATRFPLNTEYLLC